jgi:hypothetical protein
MNSATRKSFWTVVFVFILLISVGSVSAQKSAQNNPYPPLWEDTAINPHDFTSEYYAMHGVISRRIIGRRDGVDGLSVFSNSSNPYHTNVRVITTLPAYDQHGDMLFWYPLGELQDYGFTEDKIGALARETASKFPIYIFPNTRIQTYRTFGNARQAALMDNSFSMTNTEDANPLGVREIFVVNFTEKAFTKEGFEMMQYFLKKNGASADDTPIIRTIEDIQILLKNEMISADTMKFVGGRYAINPIIFDPTNGVIAQDAFILMATKDDKPLPAEDMFGWTFQCLQTTGNWCP